MKKREFDNILDKCLERILTKGETIEQCLTNYPEQAAELKPLLQTVLSTIETLAIKPRPEFMDRARYQLRVALREMEEKHERRSVFFSWQPRWATAVIAVLIFVFLSGSTVAAAGGSMPDGPLYPVKLATERVRLALTPSALGKAELYAQLADKRVTEIIKMADKGKLKQVERTTERLNSELMAMATLVSPEARGEVLTLTAPPEAAQKAAAPPVTEEPGEEGPNVLMAPTPPVTEELPEKKTEVQIVPAPQVPQEAPGLAPAPYAPSPGQAASEAKGMKVDSRAKLRMIVISNVAKHREELSAALERAPESAKPALRRALDASNAEYEKVLGVLEEEEHDGADSKDKD